jgi:hypothetical protein
MLFKHRILHNLKLNILVAKCFIASFNAKRFLNIFIVISLINIILKFSLIIVRVFGVIY